MTPLRLELEGFTCFRERTVIDLSEIGVDLFAIAGPTGAGKSTLLDAMTYALYGQTARLGSRGLDALLSPGAETLSVQLSFRTATEVYRVTRFAWQRVGRVERQTRIERLDGEANWRQLPESEKLTEANRKLAEIVGLDYEGFTRAVLLPQGAFDEFLRGDAGKRRRLLTVLLGLDRVQAMQQLAGRYSRDAEGRILALRTRLHEDFAGASPDKRRELSDARDTADRERVRAVAELARADAELAVAAELMRIDGDLRRAELEREGLAAEAEAMDEAADRLERGRRAQSVVHLIEHVATLTQRRDASVQETAAAEIELAQAVEQRERAQADAHKARRRLEDRGADVAAELERLAEVVPLAARLERAGGAPHPGPAAGTIESFDEARWEKIEGLRMQLPALKRLVSRHDESRRTIDRGVAALADLERETSELRERLTNLTERGQRAKDALIASEAALQRVKGANDVAAVRSGLKLGDPCPICGQPIRSFASHRDADVEAAQRGLEMAAAERDKLVGEYLEARSTLKAQHSRLDDRHKELTARREELERLELELSAARLPFVEAGLADATGTDPGATVELEREHMLASLAATVMRVTGGEEPLALRSRLQAERVQLGHAQQRAAAELVEADRRLEGARAGLAGLRRRFEELAADLSRAETELAAGLASSGFVDAAAALSARMPDDDIESLAERLATFATRRREVERRVVELRERLAGRSYDADAHVAVRHLRQGLMDDIETQQRLLGSLASQLERIDEMLERAKSLREELQGEQENFDTYRTLALDLRSDHFQDFLMTRVQRDLARRASHIVRTVTDGRYDLRLNAGEYQVLDGWSDGEPRSARTLSGGETFIASLALALALSDTVAGSHALGALFLDEGFGSLDSDTLDAVAGVLEALTSEGRMVGIITHVRELSERMPARLLVSKGPHGSSVRWDL